MLPIFRCLPVAHGPLAALFILSSLIFSTAAWSVEDGRVFKDWKVHCETIKDTGKNNCFIFQNLVLKEAKKLLLHVAVGYPPEKDQPVMILTLPLGISLPPGIQIKVDEGEPIRLQIEHCVPQGCKALFALDEKWLTTLKKGTKAQVAFMDGTRQPLGVPVSLSGFTAAINAIRPK